MLGTFTYHNPTKLYFGEDALDGLAAELAAFGPSVVLAYGGGSIKRNGVYDQVTRILRDAGKTVTEIAGVPRPSPTRASSLSPAEISCSNGNTKHHQGNR